MLEEPVDSTLGRNQGLAEAALSVEIRASISSALRNQRYGFGFAADKVGHVP
jgi:hypothetical protein